MKFPIYNLNAMGFVLIGAALTGCSTLLDMEDDTPPPPTPREVRQLTIPRDLAGNRPERVPLTPEAINAQKVFTPPMPAAVMAPPVAIAPAVAAPEPIKEPEPKVNSMLFAPYTQGGDRLTSLYSFDLSNNNKILDLNFDDSLKINVGSTLSMGDFSVSGLGPYNFSMSGLNPTTVSFNDLQQSLRFQSTNSINGPLLIKYTGTELQDTQGRPIPSYTWMIGSDLPNQDYDNYQILNANRLTQAEQKAGVMVLGGGGEDELTGGLGADTLVGGLDSDTLTGGLGSDTFVFAKDSGDIAGVTGDVIKDFNFGKTGGTNADTISLYQLFDSTVVSQLGKGARDDASTLSAYLKLEWTKLDSNLQMVCSVDKDGRSNFSKLFTMTDLIGSVGSGTYQANQADMSLLNGTESTNALLQKMLEEGRLVVQ